MIKKLQKIGNSKGLVLDKTILKLLGIYQEDHVELIPTNNGILLRKVDPRDVYEDIAKDHRASLDKLAK